MPDIIHLLPDSVANQIAAGEVVQRPASVVKELVENAIDAHATEITIALVDAGRTSIQISDNGIGMSETDARMAFERHATSKIKDASDIFKIRSMGFRGEALASIAAVSQTELKTKHKDSEIGTKIIIAGCKIESQEPDACPQGTTFTVKNLFFNTPARRKFLKSNQTEFNYILAEIYQTALANPDITFTIVKDGVIYAKYPKGNLKQRIIAIFGKQMDKGLLPIEDESSIVKIYGFVGVPEMARKNGANQFFFVNNRFFRQKSFLGSVMRAYGNLLPQKEYPPFFIFLEIDPSEIDVNIHPTKTEIKFSEEFNICQLLEASVKCVLGKNNIVPSLDFSDSADYTDMFSSKKNEPVTPPTIRYNPSYNPFKATESVSYPNTQSNIRNWEKLFDDFQTNKKAEEQLDFAEDFGENESSESLPLVSYCTQFLKKYILAFVNEKIYVIDIKRAHYRLLYDSFFKDLSQIPTQKTLLPVRIDVTDNEAETLMTILPQLQEIGFDIENFGQNSFVVNGAPSDVNMNEIQQIIMDFISSFEDENKNVKDSIQEKVVSKLAKSASLFRNPNMTKEEMHSFVLQVISNKSFSITPEGQIVTIIVEPEDLIKKFN
ncbi:MAG: DNA mismatch repair endonuclease MutL [Bacteroidales bacterium]|nr:DNA mismatch repair endonuclease MutL [Bacteroidales bacterium]